MRLVLSEFISLDGVIQAPGGRQEDTEGGFQHGGWSMRYFDVDSMGSFIDKEMQQTDAYVFGRKTWQVSADAWPERGGDPFADKLNSIKKYVASRTHRPRSEIDDLLACARQTPIERVRDSRESLGRLFRKLIQGRFRIAHPQGVCPAGVEMELGSRRVGDLAILLADLLT